MKDKQSVLITTFFFLIFFILIYKLNNLTLLTSDDYTYRFVYEGYMPTNSPKKIDGLTSIIISQINHWRMWNGRFVAHAIVQFFMQYKKIVFDVFNSLAFIVLIKLTMMFTTKTKTTVSPISYVFLFIFYWFFLPEIGKTVFWISGSGNYLWTSLIYMSYLYLYIYKLDKMNLVKAIPFFILAFLAGACNENSSPTILLLCGIYSVFQYTKNKKIEFAKIFSIFVGVSGFLLMMSSGGSKERGQQSLSLDILTSRFIDIYNLLIQQYLLAYILLIVLIVFYFLKVKKDNCEIRLVLMFLLGHFVSAFVLVASPELPLRTLWSSTLFLAIALFTLFNRLVQKRKKVNFLFAFVALLFFFQSYYVAYHDIKNTYFEVKEQYKVLRSANEGEVVYVKELTPQKTLYNAYNGTANVSGNSSDWFNIWMAKYFEVKEIIGYK